MMFTHRLDFGFGNPNSAGAFFAVLALAVFLIPGRRAWMTGIRGLLSGIFFSCLLLTASRGALIGLGIGSLAVWGASGFPKPRAQWVIVASLSIVLLAVGFGGKTMKRMSTLSSSDGSIASRIAIYRCVPSMVIAAPGGWGKGHGAEAYENWFQDAGNASSFKNLLSTHATWIVERGILFFALYLALWILALWMSAAIPVALGVLVAWGVALAFSHVGGIWWSWIIPALALGVALTRRWRERDWPTLCGWGVVGALMTMILALFVATGIMTAPKPGVSYHGSVIRVGGELPRRWFLSPDLSVMGTTYGRDLRQLGSFAIAEHWDALRNPPMLILSGNPPDGSSPPALRYCNELVWLNPPSEISPQLKRFIEGAAHKTIVWGGLRTDADPRALRRWFESLHDVRWIVLPGRGKYLGDSLATVNCL